MNNGRGSRRVGVFCTNISRLNQSCGEMSRKKQQQPRSAANTAETAAMSINERILRDCHELYSDEDNGLVKLSSDVGVSLLLPRRKITILLIGNHSAGKSSFINWYIEEHVQRTAVAIETQGFALITSGKKRESLTGNATLHLFPQFRELEQMDGVVDYLSTEIATSKHKKFAFVTFIDTPGLVDGDMSYPFDVDQALGWLGNRADLIFVFFDPLGQALCKRTLNIVEALSEQHPDRVRFYMSKADTAGTEGDRQRVLMQITQELCKRPGLSRAGFDMPTIFIPDLTGKNVRCENHIDEVCKEIERAVNHNIQKTLNSLEKDSQLVSTAIQQRLDKDSEAGRVNMSTRCHALLYYALGVLLPVLTSLLIMILPPSVRRQPASTQLLVLIVILAVSCLLFFIGYKSHKVRPRLTRKEKGRLTEQRNYIEQHIKTRKSTLYQDYLQQSV